MSEVYLGWSHTRTGSLPKLCRVEQSRSNMKIGNIAQQEGREVGRRKGKGRERIAGRRQKEEG